MWVKHQVGWTGCAQIGCARMIAFSPRSSSFASACLGCRCCECICSRFFEFSRVRGGNGLAFEVSAPCGERYGSLRSPTDRKAPERRQSASPHLSGRLRLPYWRRPWMGWHHSTRRPHGSLGRALDACVCVGSGGVPPNMSWLAPFWGCRSSFHRMGPGSARFAYIYCTPGQFCSNVGRTRTRSVEHRPCLTQFGPGSSPNSTRIGANSPDEAKATRTLGGLNGGL